MEKKRSKGVTIFAVFFIILGINQIILPTVFLFTHKTNTPTILYPRYKKLVSTLDEADNRLRQKEKEYDSNKYNMLNQTYTQLKQELANLKNNYIYDISRPMKIFAFLSFLSAILFIYTGRIILKLNSSFRIYITLSLIAGLFNSFAFYWQLSSVFYLPVRIADLTEMANAIDKNAVLPHMHSRSDIFKLFFLQPTNAILYIGYFIFILVLIYFFTRLKVKEQFK